MNEDSKETTSAEKGPRARDTLWMFAIATAIAGPFALPLLWRNPRFSVRVKVIISILVISLTLVLLFTSARLVEVMIQKATELQGY